MITFNEKKTGWVTVTFKDRDGVLAAPSSARYRIDDEETETEILDWTALVAASSIEIELTSTQNAVVDSDRKEEVHVLTVEATTSTGKIVTAEWKFRIANLQFYPAA